VTYRFHQGINYIAISEDDPKFILRGINHRLEPGSAALFDKILAFTGDILNDPTGMTKGKKKGANANGKTERQPA
jgi:hypothetical protein